MIDCGASAQASRGPSPRTVTFAVYALQALGLFVGVTFIAAVVIDYVQRGQVRGTFLESHVRWQIRTFWWALLWAVLSALTWVALVGMAGLFATEVWVIYRIVKGALNLMDGKPMYLSAAA